MPSRLVCVCNFVAVLFTSVDPYSDTVTRTFNGNIKLLTLTQPTGESVSLTRDGSDNVTAIAHKNSGGTTEATETMTYASGLPITKTDSNSNETLYGYSANGDLTSVTTPLGYETQFGVDGIGADHYGYLSRLFNAYLCVRCRLKSLQLRRCHRNHLSIL
jgi:YD repeat-containing protein